MFDALVVAGAAAGGTVSGPGGAATLAVAAQALQTVFRQERELRLAEMGRAITREIPVDDFIEALQESSRLRILFIEAAQAAIDTDWDTKRLLLGQAVSRAAVEDARIDIEQVLVRTTRALEPIHARILALLQEPPRRPSETEDRVPNAWHKDEIEDRLGLSPEVLDALMAPLVGTATAEDAGIGTYGGVRGVWRLTDWGGHFLNWLGDAEAARGGSYGANAE